MKVVKKKRGYRRKTGKVRKHKQRYKVRKKAYRGFSKKQRDKLDSVFESDPRLKMKRDKTITNIRKKELRHPLDAQAEYDPHKNEIHLSTIFLQSRMPPPFRPVKNTNTKRDLKRVLAHEIEHAVQQEKIGLDEFYRQYEKGKQLSKLKHDNLDIQPFGSPDKHFIPLFSTYHETTPFEFAAGVQADKTAKTNEEKGFGRLFKKNLRNIPELQLDRARYEESMRMGEPLRLSRTKWKK